MPSINDWAAKAASIIMGEDRRARDAEERIAAIIALHAEPLVKLLRESKMEHNATYLREENDQEPCPKHYDEDATVCTCGADKWNARIDEALNG
jgi:hypothetical protein